MEFFSSQIISHSDKYKPASLIPLNKENIDKKKERIARLKQQTYGEVLTNKDVLQRLKSAQEGKAKVSKGTKAKKKCQEKTREQTRKIETNIKVNENQLNDEEPKKKKKVERNKDTDSDESDISMVGLLLDTDDEEQSLTDYLQESEMESADAVDLETPIFEQNIKVGNFVLVDVKGGLRKATHFKYVCHITKVDDEDDMEILDAATVITDLADVTSDMEILDAATVITDLADVASVPAAHQ
ncbi:hypothetical protein LSTR_LSTR005292 [Laodelphax striatellus]|uniref:Uncharacterized protein n=1 Tax=Laodelphax striatellus TaxID=195883 RepID=A0A482X8M5_LAOST|nr:hypothetical protein LSTR_LSTR005292 [Laodelphax striatellus]